MANNPDIDRLAERILRGELGRLSQAELDAVLSWISGSEKLGAAALIRHLGVPRERPDVMRQVYTQLDALLFVDGQLNRRIAGVAPGADDKTRRARYRRLMTAFHPDRHPDSADWLTPRSQSVLRAYSDFRAGREKPDTAEKASKPARSTRKSAGRKTSKPRWPAERSSARLTPERGALLARMRNRLRDIDNLPGKILAGLAVVALVPVIGVYLSYKPYRDRMAPQPAPTEIARAEQPAIPMPVVETDHASVATETTVSQENPGQQTAPDPTEARIVGPQLPDEIDVHGRQSTREPAGEAEPEPTEPLDLEALAAEATRAYAQLLAYNETAWQANAPSDSTEQPESPTQTTPAEPDPEAGAPSEAIEPPESQSLNPETLNLKPSAEAQAEANPTPKSNEPSERPSLKPETLNLKPSAEAQAEADATSESEQPSENQPRNPEPRTPNPEIQIERSSAEETPRQAEDKAPSELELTNTEPLPEPAPTSEPQQVQANQPPESREPSEPEASSERPPLKPETLNLKPEAEPQADPPSESTEPSESEPIEKRVQNLLNNYSLHFNVGNLEGIIDLLADNPRENDGQGREWFRNSYARLFDRSDARRIDIDVLDVRSQEGDWQVAARFDLVVNFPGEPPASTEQLIEYTITETDDGRLRIQAIDY